MEKKKRLKKSCQSEKTLSLALAQKLTNCSRYLSGGFPMMEKYCSYSRG